jgi:hypothetical protein
MKWIETSQEYHGSVCEQWQKGGRDGKCRFHTLQREITVVVIIGCYFLKLFGFTQSVKVKQAVDVCASCEVRT